MAAAAMANEAPPIDCIARYGLTDFELGQAAVCPYPAADGSQRTGTIRDMLDQAPVMADRLASMKTEEGPAGVRKFLGGLSMMGVEVKLHGDTAAFLDGKIDETTLRIRTAQSPTARGTAGFLA